MDYDSITNPKQLRTPPPLGRERGTQQSHDIGSGIGNDSFAVPDTDDDFDVNHPYHTSQNGTPSFSPSKARAQARATYQITVLKTWLANLLENNSPEPSSTSASTNTGSATTTYDHKNDGTPTYHPLITRWENEYLTLSQQQAQLQSQGGHQSHSRAASLLAYDGAYDHETSSLAPEILKALQELMYTNQAADSHRKLLHEARKEELQKRKELDDRGDADQQQIQNEEYQHQHQYQRHEAEEKENFLLFSSPSTPNQAEMLLRDLENKLSPQAQEALLSLATTFIQLGIPPQATSLPPSSSSTLPNHYLKAINQKQTTIHHQTETLNQITQLLSSLQQSQKEAETKLNNLLQTQTSSQTHTVNDHSETKPKSSSQTSEEMQTQTIQWQREIKQISMKISEYTDRIAILERSNQVQKVQQMHYVQQKQNQNRAHQNHRYNQRIETSTSTSSSPHPPSIQDIQQVQSRIQERRHAIEKLEERLRRFHGLPADLEASRDEVMRVKHELAALKNKRENLFESVVGRST